MDHSIEITVTLLSPLYERLKKLGIDYFILVKKTFQIPFVPNLSAPPLRINGLRLFFFSDGHVEYNPKRERFEGKMSVVRDIFDGKDSPDMTDQQIVDLHLKVWKDFTDEKDGWEWIATGLPK